MAIHLPYMEAGPGQLLLSVSGAKQLREIIDEALASIDQALSAQPEDPTPGSDEISVDLRCGMVAVSFVTDLSMDKKRKAHNPDHQWVDANTLQPKEIHTPDWWDNMNLTTDEPERG